MVHQEADKQLQEMSLHLSKQCLVQAPCLTNLCTLIKNIVPRQMNIKIKDYGHPVLFLDSCCVLPRQQLRFHHLRLHRRQLYGKKKVERRRLFVFLLD